MNEIDFLISNVKEWSKVFPDLHIKYAYEHSTEFHIIEVEPASVLENNLEFRRMAHRTWRNFAKLFPNKELLIDSQADVHTMTDVKFDSERILFVRLAQPSSCITWKKVMHSSYNSQRVSNANGDTNYAFAA